MAVLSLCFCARAFSSCGKRGPLFITVHRPLTIAASLVAEHRLQIRRLSSCGSRAQLLCSIWDLPRPGLEPVSPALAGRFSTTAPPGKPYSPSLFLSPFLPFFFFFNFFILGDILEFFSQPIEFLRSASYCLFPKALIYRILLIFHCYIISQLSVILIIYCMYVLFCSLPCFFLFV